MGKKPNWAGLPLWWIRQNGLVDTFNAKQNIGEKIAALKCLISITILIDFTTKKVRISQAKLEEFTKLSHPMVIKGLKFLQSEGLILINTEDKPYEYYVKEDMEKSNWAKLPKPIALKEFSVISNRGRKNLHAIRLYIYFLSIRLSNSNIARVSYQTIISKLKMSPNDVKSAIDILLNHSLISIDNAYQDADFDFKKNPPNRYRIKGLWEREI